MFILKFQPALPAGLRSGADSAREKVFLEHYAWLLECALNMTRGQRERAEDLVHDVFVQFHAKQVDLATIGDVRGYLNGMLRNLHLLQLRRSTRHPLHQLSLLDHDTVAVSLRAQDSPDQLQSLDLLRRACEFVCYRKETALTASVLILRFFHGYYPDEICRLLSAKRKAVDQWIVRGRNDAKEYLRKPYPLPESVSAQSAILPAATTAGSFLRSLREFIFASCMTPCSLLSKKGQDFDTADLAHFVSCATCLTRRCGELGLPRIGERMADEISDRDDGKSGDGGGATRKGPVLRASRKASRTNILRRGYERRREIFEHHPKELSLTFDGQAHATLLLNAAVNTLNLSLDQDELPNCVAILSDQDFRFLILDAADLTSAESKRYSLMLSDGRSLDVLIEPETLGPSIQVVYRDSSVGVSPMLVRSEYDSPFSLFGGSEDHAALSRWERFLSSLKERVGSMMNPLLASAVLLGCASVLCLFFWTRSAHVVTGRTFLDQAARWDTGDVPNVPHAGVVHERIRISTPKITMERAIYRDIQGKRHAKPQTPIPGEQQAQQVLASAGVGWDMPLAVSSYRAWHDQQTAISDEVRKDEGGLLTLVSKIPNNWIQEETLTVRASDFHPVARTIETRAYGTIEIAELSYDVMPWGPTTDDLFDPVGDRLTGGISSRHYSVLPHMLHVPTPMELDEAELATRLVLNQLKADSGEQLEVVRAANAIQVKGIVDTDQRKHDIETQLRTVPNVISAVFTIAEMENRAASSDISSVKAVSATMSPSPLEQLLAPLGKSRDEIRQLSQQIVESAFKARRDTKATADLTQQFSTDRPLSMDASTAFGELTQRHRADVLAALSGEQRLLDTFGGGSRRNRCSFRTGDCCVS